MATAPRRWARHALLGLWLLSLCSLAAFHGGISRDVLYDPGHPPHNLRMSLGWSTAEVGARFSGPGRYHGTDLSSYLFAAERLLEARALDFEKEYAVFFTPGMPLVIAALLAVLGPEAYPLKMVALNVVAWAIALLVVWETIPRARRGPPVFALLSGLFALPWLRGWTFGFGSLMSEGLSCALFVVALGALARGVFTRSRAWLLACAVLLGLATLFRPYFEAVGQALFAVPALVLAAVTLRRGRARALLLTFVAGLLLFNGVLLPWRIYKHGQFGTVALYSPTLHFVYGRMWMPDSEVPGFARTINVACHADPESCAALSGRILSLPGETLRALALRTLVRHPLRWYGEKLRESSWLWFGADWGVAFLETPSIGVEGALLLLLGAGGSGAWLTACRRRPTPERLLFCGLAGLFVLANAAIFSLYFYEWRYSQPLRLFAYFLPLWYLAWGHDER